MIAQPSNTTNSDYYSQPKLTHLSLFSGIGGIDLAAHWAGFRTLAFCEKDRFCQGVLRKHWPQVPIYEDIYEVNQESLAANGIKPGTITLVSGGIPCQPYSVAGERKGSADDRALWPQMLRVIGIIRPDWVLIENVAGFVSLALDGVLTDLEAAGYEVGSFVFPASAVGAHHERQRVFVVAHTQRHFPIEQSGFTKKRGWQTKAEQVGVGSSAKAITTPNPHGQSGQLQPFKRRDQINPRRFSHAGFTTNSNGPGREEFDATHITGCEGQYTGAISKDGSHWSVEPGVCPVVNGVSGRLARLKALGNSVVPQQVYPILQAIADWERLARL